MPTLDEERIRERCAAVMKLLIGLPVIEAVTICASTAGLVLKAAGGNVDAIGTKANALLSLIPRGRAFLTLRG